MTLWRHTCTICTIYTYIIHIYIRIIYIYTYTYIYIHIMYIITLMTLMTHDSLEKYMYYIYIYHTYVCIYISYCTHSFSWRYLFVRVPSRIHTCDATCAYGVATMSRLLTMIGLFCKRPYKRDYILQKKPIILRSLLIVATPYQPHHTVTRVTWLVLIKYGVATISRLLKIAGLFCKRIL